jgi:actin-related protein
MTSTLKLSDFQAPLVIDIGSDRVKFTQPVLNTYAISNKIRIRKRALEKQKKFLEAFGQTNKGDDESCEEDDDHEGKNTKGANKFFGKLRSKASEKKTQEKLFEGKRNDESDYDSEEEMKKIMMKNKNKSKKDEQFTPKDSDYIDLNSNTVFDCNLFMDSFPTILGLVPLQSEDGDFFKKLQKFFNPEDFDEILNNVPEIANHMEEKINLQFDFHKDKYSYLNTRFGYEPIYSGRIDTSNETMFHWKNIVERIGEKLFQKYNFLTQLYSETPLVITQHALPFETLKHQVSKIYEIAFEEYKCPYVVICSQAMLNLFSHNLTSGLVVDMGESGTSITTVKNGFTDYDSAITNNFMSGRNITSMLALYSKNKPIIDPKAKKTPVPQDRSSFHHHHHVLPNNHFELTLKEYYDAKFLKESNPPFSCYTHEAFENIDDKFFDVKFKKKPINLKEISTLNYIYTFPEAYKCLLSTRNYTEKDLAYKSMNSDHLFTNIQSWVDFITKSNVDLKKFNERDKFDKHNFKEFEKDCILPYLNQKGNSLEKNTLVSEANFLQKEELAKFRQLSLSHILLTEIEKHITADSLNANKYINVVLSGGALNTMNMVQVLQNDFDSLAKKNRNDNFKLHFMKNTNNGETFFKGANYLSKIDDLDNVMISRQEFYDYGADYLCYNYI